MNAIRSMTATVGEHRGAPRVWLEGKYLLKAGFKPKDFLELTFKQGVVEVRKHRNATSHAVSSRLKGTIPVIDINNRELDKALREVKRVQVHVFDGVIEISASRIEQKRLTRVTNGLEGSLFSGGGMLTQAAKTAGYRPAFAVEIDPVYAEIHEANHPGCHMFCQPIEEVNLKDLPPVELLTIGIPCQPFSVARRNGEKGAPPEAHDLGDMVFWAARVIDHLNPRSIVIEEVPGFAKSGAGFILQHILTRLGYETHQDEVSPHEYGFLNRRKRAVMVAHSGTYTPPVPRSCSQKLQEILDETEDGWFTPETKSWLFDHWKKQAAKGNGFRPSIVPRDATQVPVIKKRYFAQQGDNPIVAHPTEPNTYRWFSIDEVKRIMGLPSDYVLPDAKTKAGEILGQGVSVDLFTEIIRGLTHDTEASNRQPAHRAGLSEPN